MKNAILFCLFLICISLSHAQQLYKVGDETLELKTEVEGELDLLWTITDGNYRFFIKTKDDKIIELKNNKTSGRAYDNAYIQTLNELTTGSGLSAEKVKLTTGSLKRFLDKYNKSVNIDYNAVDRDSRVNFRLGFFGGITNHPLVESIDNNSAFQLAAELEIFGDTNNPRHSGLLQARQTFGSSGDYKTTEFSLAYRLRVIKKENFNIYVQNNFATVNIFSVDRLINTTTVNQDETEFDVPFSFGIGADFKISDNSYISIVYDRLFAVNLDNRGDFPTDILVGYKFNL
ncbi:MAG: hypothetical protein ED556_00615 [Winogradskyella sp.]|uniref:hypothetical protein n=1 Tax=Winogradskyella sp. TaxID=1883156 RepID=UPI000F3FE2FF|nr:hypothetical protein [Winogradskyella sp.]RNC87724.1 MAG: hypothetical protein ED556_00615 [Winogradskyella sp.]